MSRLPTVGSDIGTWGTVLDDYLSVSHNADGTPKSPLSTQIAYVSAGAAASDSNDGFSPYLPKATVASAITALGGNPGVVQCLAGTFTISGVVPAAGQTIRGLGMNATVLRVTVDAGTGHYAIDCSASTTTSPIVVKDLTLTGPGSGLTVGIAPANMSGIKTGSQTWIENCFVQEFYAGVEIANNHETFARCKISNNYYNVYATAASGTLGNQTFDACGLDGAARASIAVAGSGTLDTCTFVQCTAGFAPVGILKEAPTTHFTALSNSWCDLQFEACGNACILDLVPGGSSTTLNNVTFIEPAFSISGSGTHYDAALPTDAAVNITLSTFRCIGDRSGNPGGATTVFQNWASAGAPSLVTTDRAPLATDFAGKWAGSEFTWRLVNGPYTHATVCNATAAVTAGQVVQLQGTGPSVKPFAADNTFSYVGVAAHTAVLNASVAVVYAGGVQVLCSEHVTSVGVRLEIDPATPAQVRAVNADGGANFAATTQVPVRYPVIATSLNGNAGINALIPAWLNQPYTDPDYVHPGQVSALPSAAAGNVGQLLTLAGNHSTTADVTYACVETAAAAFQWVQIASGTATAIGNGAGTNLTALAKSTGGGPASDVVAAWETVIIGANTYFRPLFQ